MGISMSQTVRWNLAVSAEVDRSVRMFVASQGGRKGDLSRVIEEAVRQFLFEKAVEKTKSELEDFSEAELNELINEAVTWAR